jgi:hypothetical protein
MGDGKQFQPPTDIVHGHTGDYNRYNITSNPAKRKRSAPAKKAAADVGASIEK